MSGMTLAKALRLVLRHAENAQTAYASDEHHEAYSAARELVRDLMGSLDNLGDGEALRVSKHAWSKLAAPPTTPKPELRAKQVALLADIRGCRNDIRHVLTQLVTRNGDAEDGYAQVALIEKFHDLGKLITTLEGTI